MKRTLVSKVTLISLPFLLVLAFGVANAIRNLTGLRALSTHVSEHVIDRVDANGEFLVSVHRAIVEGYQLAGGGDEEALQEFEAALADSRQQLAGLAKEHAEDPLDESFNESNRGLQQRRQALIAQLEQIPAAVSAQPGDPTQAVERLETIEDEARRLNEDSRASIEQNIGGIKDQLALGTRRAQLTAPIVLTLFTVILIGAVLWLRARIARPLGLLARKADAVAGGDLDQEIAITSDDEIGALQGSFRRMIDNLRGQRKAIEQRNAELEISLGTQQQLLETVQQLSTPLLPVLEGVVVLPIVGHLDERRAQELTATLLGGVARQRARLAILDITGLAAADASTLGLLLQSMQAVELLGARAALAGITAEMAQLMVSQDLNLGSLATYQDLRTAIETAIGEQAGRN